MNMLAPISALMQQPHAVMGEEWKGKVVWRRAQSILDHWAHGNNVVSVLNCHDGSEA